TTAATTRQKQYTQGHPSQQSLLVHRSLLSEGSRGNRFVADGSAFPILFSLPESCPQETTADHCSDRGFQIARGRCGPKDDYATIVRFALRRAERFLSLWPRMRGIGTYSDGSSLCWPRRDRETLPGD